MSYLDSYIASNRSRAENSRVAAEQAKSSAEQAKLEAENTLQEVKDERTSAISEIQSKKEIALDNFTANFEDFISSSAGVNPQYISLVVNQVPQDYVEDTGLPYGQYPKGNNLYQLVYWDSFEEVWKDLGDSRPSKNYVDFAVGVLSSVTDFQNLIPTPEEKEIGTVVKNLVSFHLDLGIGGGLFYWNENKSTAYHDGGLTTIDPNWNNGTFGDIQDPNWYLRDPNTSVSVNASESLQIKGVWERVNIDYVYPEFGGAIPDSEVLPKERIGYDEDGDVTSVSIPNTFNPALVTDNTEVLRAAVNSPYPLKLTSNAYYITDTITLNSPKVIVGSGAASKVQSYRIRNSLPYTSEGKAKYETYKNVASFIYTDQDINILDIKADNITLRDFGIDTSWVVMDISGDWQESDRKAAILYYLNEPITKQILDNIHIYGNKDNLEEHVNLGRYGILVEETQPSIDLNNQIEETQQSATGWLTMKCTFNLACWNLHTVFKVTPKVWPETTNSLGIIPTFANSFVCDILADNIKRCFDVNTITAGGMSVFKAYLQARPIVHIPTAESELGLISTSGKDSVIYNDSNYFNGYDFTFNTDNTISVTKSGNTFSGTYSITDQGGQIQLSINFAPESPLYKLTEDFIFDSINEDRIKFSNADKEVTFKNIDGSINGTATDILSIAQILRNENGLDIKDFIFLGRPKPYIDWPFNIIRHEGSEVDIYAWDLNNPIDPFANTEGQFRPAIAFDLKSRNMFLGPFSKTMVGTGRVLPDNIRLAGSSDTGVNFPFRTHNVRNFWAQSGMVHSIHNAFHSAQKRFNVSIKDYKASDVSNFDVLKETTTLISGVSGYTINNPNNLFDIGVPVTEVFVNDVNSFDKDLSFVEIVVDLGSDQTIWNIWTSIDFGDAKPKRVDIFTVDSSNETVSSKTYSQEYEDQFYQRREGGVSLNRASNLYPIFRSDNTEFYLNNGNNPFRKLIIRISGLGNTTITSQNTLFYINSLIGDRYNPSIFDYGTILTKGGQRIYGDLTVDSIKYPTGSNSHPQTKYLSFDLTNNNVPNLGTPVTLFPQPVIIKSVYIRKYQSVTPYTENSVLSLYSLNSPSSIYNVLDIDLNNLPVQGKYLDISEYFILGGLLFGSRSGNPGGGDISDRILVYIEYVDFSDISEPNYTLPQ